MATNMIRQVKVGTTNYDINSVRTGGILYGKVDASSTSTAYTATIEGLDGCTAYYDGLTVLLKNGVVTSASGFTININGLGAKQVYNNMAAATAETTIFNVNYTMLFIYDSTRVSGGGWVMYRGYNSAAANDGALKMQVGSDARTIFTANQSNDSTLYTLKTSKAYISSWNAGKMTSIDVSKFNGGSFTRGSFNGGSFTQGTDSFTAASLSVSGGGNTASAASTLTLTFSGGSFTQGIDSFTAATHGNDSFTAASLSSGFYTAGTKPSLNYTNSNVIENFTTTEPPALQ